MEFDLFYKKYPYKVSWDAKRQFKRETGRGLWSTIQGILPIIQANNELGTDAVLREIGNFIDDVDGAILLWVLAKQMNSTLQLSEVSDAIERSGWRSVEDDTEMAQPYTYVLYKIMHQLDEHYELEAKKAKKEQCN